MTDDRVTGYLVLDTGNLLTFKSSEIDAVRKNIADGVYPAGSSFMVMGESCHVIPADEREEIAKDWAATERKRGAGNHR